MRYLVNIMALIMRETAHFLGFLSLKGQKVVFFCYYEGPRVLVGEVGRGGPVKKGGAVFVLRSLTQSRLSGGFRGGLPTLA